jgi:hypothetical protein
VGGGGAGLSGGGEGRGEEGPGRTTQLGDWPGLMEGTRPEAQSLRRGWGGWGGGGMPRSGNGGANSVSLLGLGLRLGWTGVVPGGVPLPLALVNVLIAPLSSEGEDQGACAEGAWGGSLG